ncbi:MAG: methionine--tRNA ligase, partial [Deltaproteobacteria bacterium]|nr:methionine--tRNA ligase [Deltaproteobacteria bacterium]
MHHANGIAIVTADTDEIAIMKKNKFYITTAIDYVNSTPHIGTAYEKIGADVLARWHRLICDDVHFQMGNDEHSLNVQRAAKKAGLTPKAYCDQMRITFEEVWKKLSISYDDFIQTSDKHHEQGVQELFRKILAAGDIYPAEYEGWYCESCEAFYTEKDLTDGKCPNHKIVPKWLKEKNYFFALKKYRTKLLAHIEAHPGFVVPETRRNEILALLQGELQDISISRSTFDWGIQLPNDPKHVVYVWFDALINYISAVGYGSDEPKFKKWWPADVHVIGKDITRFHCVIWPAMLMSAGLPLPKTVFAHGFVSFKGEKMSKSLGNVVTPLDVVDKYGADALRYYLLREGSFGGDSDFTWEQFINRYNGDLANGLGNLVSRTIGMAEKYLDSTITPVAKKDLHPELQAKCALLEQRMPALLSPCEGDVSFHTALALLWETMAAADKYINDTKPWLLAKEGKIDQINAVLYNVAAVLRQVTHFLSPFMPETAKNIWQAFGFQNDQLLRVKLDIALFPRIEEAGATAGSPLQKTDDTKQKEKNMIELIDITDFAKVELRVAEILTAEKIEGADKL